MSSMFLFPFGLAQVELTLLFGFTLSFRTLLPLHLVLFPLQLQGLLRLGSYTLRLHLLLGFAKLPLGILPYFCGWNNINSLTELEAMPVLVNELQHLLISRLGTKNLITFLPFASRRHQSHDTSSGLR